MKIPLVDLVAQYESIRDEIDRAIDGVLARGTFILGPEVSAFEEDVAAYLGVRHAVGVASGTDALLLTLRAYGIGPDDEVIVPAFTFFSTAEVVSQLGAIPVFVDIDPRTYCLDVGEVERRITPKTRAIIPVHLYGHPADMDSIRPLAVRHGLTVIEDNAQAMGAEYRGRKTGSLGNAACLSFFPTKNLGGYGDGGMVVTDDPALADHLRKLRTHGWRTKYQPETLGFNSRLDEIQAAVLRVKLRHLDGWNGRRRDIAERYRRRWSGDPEVQLPEEADYARHVFHLYVIRISHREAVMAQLRSLGIGCGVYYPQPLHQVEPYRSLRRLEQGNFPEAERAARETLAVPLYPEMSEAEIDTVVSAVRNAQALGVAGR